VHEMSLAAGICRIAEAHVGPGGCAALLEVGVEVGERAGVEVGSLEFCLEAMLSAAPFGRARPAITRLAGDELRVTYLEVDDGGETDRRA
jgi:Zn finger protein HypA/HybF involved in hydrogenase expression